jgi:site-specific recombinase XerD
MQVALDETLNIRPYALSDAYSSKKEATMAKKSQKERDANEKLMEEFLDALALEGRSQHSLRSYRTDLTSVLAANTGPLSEMRTADLREHFRQRLATGLAPSTVNHAMAATKSFVRFLPEEGHLETDPTQTLRAIRIGQSLAPKHLTVAEVERLLSIPDTATPTGRRDYAVLMVLYNTGLRVGELCSLNRDDVQLPRKVGERYRSSAKASDFDDCRSIV